MFNLQKNQRRAENFTKISTETHEVSVTGEPLPKRYGQHLKRASGRDILRSWNADPHPEHVLKIGFNGLFPDIWAMSFEDRFKEDGAWRCKENPSVTYGWRVSEGEEIMTVNTHYINTYYNHDCPNVLGYLISVHQIRVQCYTLRADRVDRDQCPLRFLHSGRLLVPLIISVGQS